MKQTIYFTLAVLGAAIFPSCQKQLDALPKDALVEGNAIVSQQTANIALNGVYYRFANASVQTTDWVSNQVYPGILSGFLDDGNNDRNEASNNLARTGFNGIWGRYYRLINAANGVIGQVSELPDALFSGARKQEILAEARFMRAYGHFKVLCWFGQWFDSGSAYGALVHDRFVLATTYAKPRSTVADSYAFILEDLDAAIAGASGGAGNATVNRWTAMALKMRVLLNRGQAEDHAACATLGRQLIAESPFALEGQASAIFYSKGLGSTETMLGVVPQANQGAYYYNTSGVYVVRSAYYVATDRLAELLEGDPRKSWYIGGPGNYGKGHYFIKYVQPSLATTQLSEVAYAFRLTEAYLMTAEAIVRSGGSLDEARTLLKEVLARAGVSDFSVVDGATDRQAFLVQLYYEYVRNFVGEDDQYYFALLRFPLDVVTALRPTITTREQYIYPVPTGELENNLLFGPQNPGYAQ